MGRKRVWPPRVGKNRGRDRVWWNGRWHDLGPSGSDKSKTEYSRLLAVWSIDPTAIPRRSDDILALELCRQYLASTASPKDGRQRTALKQAIRLLAEQHQSTTVTDFDPPALAAWQEWLCKIPDPKDPKRTRYNVTSVGHFTNFIRQIWKWGVATGRIGAEQWQALLAVPRPKPGTARPARDVAPADPEAVKATVPFLRPPVRAMILLEWMTGARPDEICRLRASDIQRSGRVRVAGTQILDLDKEGVWVAILTKHKTEWKGKARWLTFGPEAQEILTPFLDRPSEAYLFSPRESLSGMQAEAKQERISKRAGGSGGNRKKPSSEPRRINDRYSPRTYHQAVARACEKAFPPPGELARRKGETKTRYFERLGEKGKAKLQEWNSHHRWFPYQLRHLAAIEVKAAFGIDAVQALLGHHTRSMSEHYGGTSFKVAAAAAKREIG